MKSPDMEENPTPPKERNNSTSKIVGFNMLAMVIYTIICRFAQEAGPVIDMFLIGIHFLICLFALMTKNKSAWALSAALVLLLGCSSCVGVWTLI